MRQVSGYFVACDNSLRWRVWGAYHLDQMCIRDRVSWDPAVVNEPGVVVGQPDRPPVVVSPTGGGPGRPCPPCDDAAEKLLDCLGLPGVDVKRARIKSVNVEIDLDDCGCGK